MSLDKPEKNMQNSPSHNEELISIDEQWEKSQENPIIKRLLAGERLQDIMETLPGFKEAFQGKLDTVVCSDERVPAGKGKKIGFAGQLILAKEAEFLKFILDYLWDIKEVTSHDNCGAAQKKYKDQLHSGDIPPGVNTPDDWGKWHSQRFVNLINNFRKEQDPERAEKEKAVYRHIPKKQDRERVEKELLDYRRIPQTEMTGEFHNARAICFDGTGKFDPSVMPDMPEVFVCSAPGFGLSKEYCQEELYILSNIALGHGFREKFTKETPFYIFVSANDDAQLKELMSWAKEAIDKVEGATDRIKVEGFVFQSGKKENQDKK